MMRVAILGAGGLGSVFGAVLALAGVEVTLIAARHTPKPSAKTASSSPASAAST
jgi:ketopantoate reductase